MEDSLYPFLKIYGRLPKAVQDVIGRTYRFVPKSLRYGPFYREYRGRIQRFERVTDTAVVQRMQLELLKETVNRAVEDIPFYRKFLKIETLAEFQELPVIGKNDIVANTEAFISAQARHAMLKSNTGGSSGTPMEFFLHSGRTRPKESAHYDWFWGQRGFVPGARILMIRGAPLKCNALYEYQAIKNCLAISCYEMNSSNVGEVLRAVQRFRPEFVHGYPSAVKNVMSCMGKESHAIWSVPIRALFLGSEWLSPDDRSDIEEFFNSKVLTWYGHSECAVMGGNSGVSNEFFFFPFYGYTELLDDIGNPVSRPGEVGRIIATSFDNYVMPFIRYDTGDFGVLSSVSTYKNIPCLVLSRIEGRSQDTILLSDCTKVSVTAFIFGQHLREFSKIREMQLEQSVPGRLLLRIVRGINYAECDERQIVKSLRRSVSDKIDIQCEYVERIVKTHRGKHRFLIQKTEGVS